MDKEMQNRERAQRISADDFGKPVLVATVPAFD